MEIKKVLCTVDYPEQYMAEIRKGFENCQFVHLDYKDTEGILREITDCDVAVLNGDITPEMLNAGKNLRWVHCNHAGVNASATPELFNRGILLSGAGGRSSEVLAEHTIYFMLCSCYHTREQLENQKNHHWGAEGSGNWRGLYGKTAGIMGMGNNGRQLALRLNAMGMKIISYDRNYVEGTDFVAKQLVSSKGDTPEELFANADFVLLNMPLTDSTFHIIDKAAFSKMKDGAVLVNMARGGLVDTDAMIDALNEGKLSCAGLDVFETEPLEQNSPLWDMENVYITPHCTPAVPDKTERCVYFITENARRYKAGEKLLNLMDSRDMLTKKDK